MNADRNRPGPPRGRIIALMIAATGVIYLGVQLLGSVYGWSTRAMAFFDLAALALFGWAIVETYLIWRKRQDDKES